MESPNYLTDAQVQDLNEKHGWFEYGDAQSDVSKAFAQDAIAMHERIRAAAPELLDALKIAEQFMSIASDWNFDEAEINGEMRSTYEWLDSIRAAIAKATGEAA